MDIPEVVLARESQDSIGSRRLYSEGTKKIFVGQFSVFP